ncbi:hypothetical protein [Lachnoclostridium phytofermentans]|uniref:Uncharacterized protein n=1 Tax=Lachnoclostridium phytofermentans (strain ATCC 700394 / DSM 18823 / ISDg) TaxID=357809 RepID=A9KQ20_LACP7|nr:hypothetical protein [Lachnoclostridium phytofermentans]ABX43332.1 conserved hypothetical protein [Lachnoclostridium phytofermentans ISDg]
MGKTTTDELIDKAVKKAVKEFINDSKKKNRNAIKKRTRKLMSSYNSIKSHVDEGVSEVLDASIGFVREDLDEDDLYIMSIRRSRIRSMIMVAHIDKCLALLKAEEERKGTPEKYEVFISHYLEEKTYDDLSSAFSCSSKTAMRWVIELEGLISLYLYGVDGLSLD